jgi:hypothetical protein
MLKPAAISRRRFLKAAGTVSNPQCDKFVSNATCMAAGRIAFHKDGV